MKKRPVYDEIGDLTELSYKLRDKQKDKKKLTKKMVGFDFIFVGIFEVADIKLEIFPSTAQ